MILICIYVCVCLCMRTCCYDSLQAQYNPTTYSREHIFNVHTAKLKKNQDTEKSMRERQRDDRRPANREKGEREKGQTHHECMIIE